MFSLLLGLLRDILWRLLCRDVFVSDAFSNLRASHGWSYKRQNRLVGYFAFSSRRSKSATRFSSLTNLCAVFLDSRSMSALTFLACQSTFFANALAACSCFRSIWFR